MAFTAVDVYGAEGTRRAQVLAGTAADAFVGIDRRRHNILRIRVLHISMFYVIIILSISRCKDTHYFSFGKKIKIRLNLHR